MDDPYELGLRTDHLLTVTNEQRSQHIARLTSRHEGPSAIFAWEPSVVVGRRIYLFGATVLDSPQRSKHWSHRQPHRSISTVRPELQIEHRSRLMQHVRPPAGDRPWALGPGFHGALGTPGPVVLGLSNEPWVGLWVGRFSAASMGAEPVHRGPFVSHIAQQRTVVTVMSACAARARLRGLFRSS